MEQKGRIYSEEIWLYGARSHRRRYAELHTVIWAREIRKTFDEQSIFDRVSHFVNFTNLITIRLWHERITNTFRSMETPEYRHSINRYIVNKLGFDIEIDPEKVRERQFDRWCKKALGDCYDMIPMDRIAKLLNLN